MIIMTEKWSKEKAWSWYNQRPWIRGYNGYPSNCVNRIAFWQEYRHEEVFEQIEQEFALARETGFNAVRAIIQFECWYYQHDSFMKHLEEYLTLAERYGIGVMLTLGNDCLVPKEQFKPVEFGEQHIDWGYHSGTKRNPHTGDYKQCGYCLLDEPEFEPFYYKMVDEIAAKYAKDPRILFWDVWNEPGNSNRLEKSQKAMERFFEIIRSHDPIQPLTAAAWLFSGDKHLPTLPIEYRALELSDIISFHYYCPFPNMVQVVKNLKELYGRPIVNSEWFSRISNCNIMDIFPLFYLEQIGSFHWGLIQGYSQTYEPHGGCFLNQDDPNQDLTKWMHDLYRFNGYPYDPKEIKLIKHFCRLADEDFKNKQEGN